MISELKYWKTDVPSGLIVFLVAIPLCLGIALASGAEPLSGVIAGIVGGLVVTLFSNSSLGVSGPAAGLVAIVEPAIQQLGFQNFLLAVVLSGVFQFALGMLKAGTIGYYFPTAVIKGMLVAIGLIIILKQIPHAVGYDADYEGDLAFQQSDGLNTFTEISNAFGAITTSAFIITAVSLGILILWESKFMKQFSFSKIIQGPLVAVVAGIVLNLAFASVDSMKLKDEQHVRLPRRWLLRFLILLRRRSSPRRSRLVMEAVGTKSIQNRSLLTLPSLWKRRLSAVCRRYAQRLALR